MNTPEEFIQEKFRIFARDHDISGYTPFAVFREAFSIGFDAGIGYKSKPLNEHAHTDLKEKAWLFKPTDSNNLYEMASDIETLKKYVKILMEWKNASNP